jgi:hypothetical protein
LQICILAHLHIYRGCESTKNTYVDNRLLDDLPEKSNFVNHEQVQELYRVECVWRLYCYRRQAWDRDQQDPAVFYLRFNTYHGLAGYHLPRACFLEKYQEIYMGGQEESMVLSIILLFKNKSRAMSRLSVINGSPFRLLPFFCRYTLSCLLYHHQDKR